MRCDNKFFNTIKKENIFLNILLFLTLLNLSSCIGGNGDESLGDDFGIESSSSSGTGGSSSGGSATVAGGLNFISFQNVSVDTSGTSTVRVIALDSTNEAKSGVVVNFTLNYSTGGSLSVASVTTGGDGIAQTIFTAPATTETPTVSIRSTIGTLTSFITVGAASSTPTYSAVSFSGVSSATVIDDNTVRLFFPSPIGGSGINGFNVYLDSDFSTVHQSFGLGAYSTDSASGNLYVDVVGLAAATAYDFTVRHLDILQGVESAETNTVSVTTAAAVSAFAGIDSISDVTSTGSTLNWTAPTGVTRYDIYNVTSGTPVYYGTTAASNTSYVITGLDPSTSYTWRVRYVNSQNITDDNTEDVSQATASPPGFAGGVNISNTTTTSLQVNWAHVASAASYKLYYASDLTSAITTITAPTAFASVTGLSSGTSYSFVVRAVDSVGGEDTNVVVVTDSTSTVSATFNGWTNVYSVGPRVDFQANQIQKESITLSWKQISNSGGTLSGYNLYYSSDENGSYTKINTSAVADLGGSDISYLVPVEDITPGVDLVPGTVYFFKIAAIISGDEVAMTASPSIADDKTIIRVVYPPNNIALVHRWIANQDTCGEYNRGLGTGASGSDKDNHYRCEFNGLGSTEDSGTYYYDLGRDLLVDVNELGCNFTQSACTSHNVGTTVITDCIGNDTPDNTIKADQYSVFYDRSMRYDGGGCFIQMDSDSNNPRWVQTYNLSATTEISYTSTPQIGDDLTQNNVNLPPMYGMTPLQAFKMCESHTIDVDIEGSSTEFRKRTLRKKEWHAAAAWGSEHSVVARNDLEAGIGAASCNSANVNVGSNDLDATYSDANWVVNADNSSDSRIQTGTSYTAQCRTRYGIQDMVGNVNEYVSDHFSSSGNCSGSFATSTPNYDTDFYDDWKNSDGNFVTWTRDGGNEMFRCRDSSNGVTVSTNAYYRFTNAAMGLGLYCGSTNTCNSDDKYISSQSSGGTINNYNAPSFSDVIYTESDSISTYGISLGGNFEQAISAGRYTMFFVQTNSTGATNSWREPKSTKHGTRCMVAFPYN